MPARADASGHRFRRRQVADRGRTVPRLWQSRAEGGALQAAEHVEQRGDDAREWRDRPGAGAAGARRPRRAGQRHESGAFEAAGRRRAEGLGLLDVERVSTGEKSLRSVSGATADGTGFRGYEMHVGRTRGPDTERAFATLEGGRLDGAVSRSGRVAGTYVHGLFAEDRQRWAWLTRLGGEASDLDYDRQVDETLDALAEHLAGCIDLERLLSHAA